ncbi:hypothetical protein BGZ57DRAFT_977160 [Hyaloscypha finlandica]|nr:hypothetical protein BGZ57DRAFT_977160 [Hyaloscypha finlandica]
MQFFSTIAFSMIATLAIAAPVADPAPAADAAAKQDLVDFWQDAGFLGLKRTGASTVGTCVNLSGTGFEDNITSAKSKPGFRCTTWVDANCKGTGFSFNASPGSRQFPSWIDNKSSSWKCVVDN